MDQEHTKSRTNAGLRKEINQLKLLCQSFEAGDETILYNKKYSDILEKVYNANLDKEADLVEDFGYINLCLGNMIYAESNYEKSLEFFNAAAFYYYNTDKRTELANAMQGIADSHYMLEQYSKVLEYNPIMMEYYKEKGEKSKEAYVAYFSAESCLKLDKYDEAASYANKALELCKSIQEISNQASSYNLLGRIKFCDNNYASAIDNYLMAIVIREKLGLKEFMPTDFIDLGDAYYWNNNNKKAKAAYLRAHNYNSISFDKELQKTIYKNLVNVCYYLDEENEALGYAFEALRLYDENDDQYELIEIYTSIGKNYFSLKNYSEALKAYSNAEKICSQYNNNQDDINKRAYLNVRIYYCCYNMKEYTAGIQFLKYAIEINKEYDNNLELADNYYEMAYTFFRGFDELETAKTYCDFSLDILKAFPNEAYTLKGKVYELYGDIAPKYLLSHNKEFLEKHRRHHAIEATENLKMEILKETMEFYKNANKNYLKAEEYDKMEIAQKKMDILIETISKIDY